MDLPPAEPGVFRRPFEPSYLDADAASRLRATALLNLLQAQAGLHTASRGVDDAALRAEGVYWVLSRLVVETDRWPRWPGPLTVDTWSRDTRAVFALRDYRFGDAEGRCGRATSAWVLLKDRRPQRPEPWVAAYEKVRPEEPLVEVPEALPPWEALAEGPDETRPMEADWEDVDLNGHVNNVRSVGWCLARHDGAFLRAWWPARIEAQFLAEMFLGERFVVRWREVLGDPPDTDRRYDYQVEGADSGKPTLRVRVSYRARV